MKVFITGMNGFIGFHLSNALQNEGVEVSGIDSFTDYYSSKLKRTRWQLMWDKVMQYTDDLNNRDNLRHIFGKVKPDVIVHLAAQPGVRHCLTDPFSYIENNVKSFVTLIEVAKEFGIKKILYASSSSVYGENYSEEGSKEIDSTESPQSFYALTKKTTEMIADLYTGQTDINFIGLRFFTVFGEYGRPDMAYWKFVENVSKDLQIEIYGDGKAKRAFTHVSVVVDAIKKLINTEIENHEVFNIGSDNCISVNELLQMIKETINPEFNKVKYLEKITGDVKTTKCNSDKLKRFGIEPLEVDFRQKLNDFIQFYQTEGHKFN